MKVDALASNSHYLANLRPIFDALPDAYRGDVYTPKQMGEGYAIRDIRHSTNLALTASNQDAHRAPGRTILIEHGIGQSYSGDEISARNMAYAGGEDRGRNVLFLAPNEQAAARDRTRYPDIPVQVIGSPYFAQLQQIGHVHGPVPTVAITTHWACPIAREAGSAWGPFRDAFRGLAERADMKVIGTSHPRIWQEMRPHYQRMGIEPVESLEEIIARADVVIFDNTSAGFYAAACGIPVVVLDAPWWDRNVNHGGRFWDWADIGPRIVADRDPAVNLGNLNIAVDVALSAGSWPGADEIIDQIFPPVEDPAAYAAARIVEYIESRTWPDLAVS